MSTSSPQRNYRNSSPFRRNGSPSTRARSVDRISRSHAKHDDPPSEHPDGSTASYLAYPVSRVANSLYRRLTEDVQALGHHQFTSSHTGNSGITNGNTGPIYRPQRTASPFAPPPLTSLTLRGHKSPKQQILSRGLAEEIRLLLPPRLQLAAEWQLSYSVETDGVSLATLYERCLIHAGEGHGYVLVIKDGLGGTFGAYLTDPPHPNPHYFGTGECFLWRATILPASSWLSNLPPPPSADTSNLQRSTTILADDASEQTDRNRLSPDDTKRSGNSRSKSPHKSAAAGVGSAEDLSDRIRFKAFPYSGINDYMIFCEPGFLSVGGGDGKYGLWLDSSLERGISSSCLTFGNEALSDEGEKFEVIGVEVWWVAN